MAERETETEPGAASTPPVLPPLVQVRDLAVHFQVPATASLGLRLPRDVPDLGRLLASALGPRRDLRVRAVDGVSFSIEAGETLGLVGESGSGKSTLGRALVRLERPARGFVHIDSIDVRRARGAGLKRLRRRVQMVFQDPYASLNPRMTAFDIVAEPLLALGLEKSEKAREARVRELFDRCGLDPRFIRRYPHEFSGGQRQRVAIARALAPGPRLLIADEPVSALDVSVQAQIVNLLAELQRDRRLSLLFIAHDLAVVRYLSQRVAVMYLGRLVEVGPCAEVYAAPCHPYTRALLAAAPVLDPSVERARGRPLLEGDAPSPLSPPSGCAFHPRCPEARERCRIEEPLLKIGKLDRPVACHVAHGEA